MATIIQGYVFGKRTQVSGSWTPNCAITYPAGDLGGDSCGWSDVSQQINGEIASLPIGIFYGEITTAQGTAINADANFLVIGWQQFDMVTKATSGGNWTQVLTQVMVNAMKTWFTTNWPGVPAGLGPKVDTLVGKTRVQAARTAIAFMDSVADANS